MFPLPFLFKQQLEYCTSHFAQPLPSFSKKPTNQLGKQTNSNKKTLPNQTSQQKKKPPQTTQLCPFSPNYSLLLAPPLLFLPFKFNILRMLDHSPSFVQGVENQLSTLTLDAYLMHFLLC